MAFTQWPLGHPPIHSFGEFLLL